MNICLYCGSQNFLPEDEDSWIDSLFQQENTGHKLLIRLLAQAAYYDYIKNAIKNNQLAHAFLFCGPRGVGKTTCARILAKTINCENRTADGESLQ